MGMVLFNKSGSFNPSSYGLSVGDLIQVVVVGGGGGGAALGSQQSISVPRAGNGGSSSFGSYLTAAGGAGGGSTRLTQGSCFGGYSATAKYSNSSRDYCVCAGGGAGGWHPYADIEGGHGQDGFAMGYTTNSAAVTPMVIVPAPIALAGGSGAYIIQPGYSSVYAKQGRYGGRERVSGGYYSDGYYVGVFRGLHSILNGGGSGNGDGRGTSGAGGSGYGAGGGSGAGYIDDDQYAALGYAGNSGEIKRTFLTLTSVNAIAVTVGGGGSGSAINHNKAVAGKNGGAGTAGASATATFTGEQSQSSISGRGGYGDTPAGDGTYSTGYSGCSAGGGGAGGCVAIFW